MGFAFNRDPIDCCLPGREIATPVPYRERYSKRGREAENVMAAHRKIRLGLIVLLACLSAPAMAQIVPLPTPRPSTALAGNGPQSLQVVPGKQAIPSQALRARAQATQGNQATPGTKTPNPVSNPFAALLGRAITPGILNADQRAIVDRVNAYLSGVQTLTGNFVQVGPDGSRTQGEFFISKPGRVRFEYDDPSPRSEERRVGK